MHLQNKQKFLDPTFSSSLYLYCHSQQNSSKEMCRHVTSNSSSTFGLESTSVKLSSHHSTKMPVMLKLMATSQSSSYMTCISDCMSQFAQDSLGFTCSPQMITNNLLFHLKSIPLCTSYVITQHYLFDIVAHTVFLGTFSFFLSFSLPSFLPSFLPFSFFLSFIYFLTDFRERQRERETERELLFHLFVHLLVDSHMCPGWWIEPTTLVYQDNAVNNWATQPGALKHFIHLGSRISFSLAFTLLATPLESSLLVY